MARPRMQKFKMVKFGTQTKLKDQYIQHWSQLSNVSISSGNNCKLFKTTFECGQYFKLLPENLAKCFLAFRTRNHRLPVEVGRWTGIHLHERTCTFCNNDIGDEYHYLLVCKKSSQMLSSISHKKPQTTRRSWTLDRNTFARTNLHILQQRHR